MYIFLILIPIQGMLLTWVSGSDVILLGIIKLPRLIEEDFILHKSVHGCPLCNDYYFVYTVLNSFICFNAPYLLLQR